jgi:hypothetical protein
LNRLFYIVIFFVLPLTILEGQVSVKDTLIQVTGIVSDYESVPVPGVSIISHKLRRGTISDLSGIYNIISVPGDTIWLSALGYKTTAVMIPTGVGTQKLTRDILLLNDTIAIKDVVILPWKNYEEFKRAVLAEKNITPQMENMYENLANIQNSISNSTNFRSSPEAAYRMSMQQNADALYTRGQSPANNLLNPFAWAKFFNGIKHGLLKNQKSTELPGSKTKIKKKQKKT